MHNIHEQYEKEADFLSDTIKWLSCQPDIMTIRINDNCHRGYSDLFLCVRGWFVAIELKDNTGTPSAHQKEFIKDLRHFGGVAGVAYTLQEVFDLVDTARRNTYIVRQ